MLKACGRCGRIHDSKLKAAGFPNVVNISTINNDVWVMNNVSYSALYLSLNVSGLVGNGFFGLYLDLSPTTYDAFFPICETSFGLQIGRYGCSALAACFPVCQGIFNEDGSVARVEIHRRALAPAYSAEEGFINGKYRVYNAGVVLNPSNLIAPVTITPDDPQYALIKDFVVEAATPKYEDSILIYKNIFLMNGAKILNEDDTVI